VLLVFLTSKFATTVDIIELIPLTLLYVSEPTIDPSVVTFVTVTNRSCVGDIPPNRNPGILITSSIAYLLPFDLTVTVY
jgi:hypothetical protein